MFNHISCLRRIFLAAMTLCLAAGSSLVTGSAFAATSDPPEDAGFEFEFPAGTLCLDVGFHILVTGETKTISLDENTLIVTSPGLKVTLTNLADESKQVTRTITGPFHTTLNPDGSSLTVSTGQSLLFDATMGLVFVTGRFTYISNPDGTLNILPGWAGQIEDACALIE